MSHQHDETLLLSENDNGALCKCKSCNTYTLAYKTLFIPFNQKAFYAFEKVLYRFQADDYNIYHPQGFKAIIRSSQSDIAIALTYLEVQELRQLYQEAKLMDEVFGVLSE